MFEFRWAQCRRVQPSLWDYASERLPEAMMEQVEQHVRQCDMCSRELTSLKRAQGLLAACRAQEEPAPRSDWNDLQQRIVSEGLAHIATPGALRSVPAPRAHAGRERFQSLGRLPWTMQLATSAAGGFVAVLVLGLGYGAFHLHNTSGMQAGVSDTVASGNASPVAPSPFIRPAASATAMVAATNPAQNAGTRANAAPATAMSDSEMIANIVVAVKRAQQEARQAAGNSTPLSTARSHAASGTVRNGSLIPENGAQAKRTEGRIAHVAARGTTRPTSVFPRSSAGAKTLAANAPKFRHYTPRPNERLAASAPTLVASRYALEHVQPVSTEGDDSNIYVVGSVRPVAHDDEGVY